MNHNSNVEVLLQIKSMRAILPVLIMALFYPFCFTMLILGWVTRILLLVILVSISIIGRGYYEKHNRPERFDDKLTQERMDSAREWLLINHFKGGDRVNLEDSTM